MLLSQQLAMAAQRAGNQAAFYDLGKEIRFNELSARVARLSYLYQNELGQNARVAFLANNRPSLALTFFALTNTRATIIPIDPCCGFEQIGSWLKESGATHIAVSSDCTTLARDVLKSVRLSLPLIEVEKKVGGEYDASFIAPPESPPKDTDIVLLLRTAGMTEKPRLVAFDHHRLQHAISAIKGTYKVAGTDRFLTPMNWFHPFAFVHGMLFPVLNGNTCVVDPGGLEKRDFLKFLRDSKVTRLAMSALQARELLGYCKENGSKLGMVKSITVGLEEVSPELSGLSAAVETPLIRCYGQTENVWTISMDDGSEVTQDPKPASKTLSGLKYKVVDRNGDTLEGRGSEEARTGQLCVSGPAVMVGYRGLDPGTGKENKELEKTTKMKIRGTWLYTGDIATLTEDQDGTTRLDIVGRREQLFAVGEGYVSPTVIDTALRGIPGVSDGAGFVTHDLQQKPMLVCAVLKEEASPLRPQDILVALQSRLPPEQAPSAVVLADSIPRTLAGVNRCKLSRQFSGISPTDLSSSAAAPTEGAPAGEAAPRPAADQKIPYVTCELHEIIPSEPLPVAIYLLLQHRFVCYIDRGKRVDRQSYDRLQFKGVNTFFIREDEHAVFLAWSRQHRVEPPAAPAPTSGPELFRSKVRDRALALFQQPHSNEKIQQLIETSQRLISEVISAPLAVRSLSRLQQLASGTVDHSINVSMISTYLALQMGYSHQIILQHIATGALLHDLGKAFIAIDEKEPEVSEAKLRKHPLLALAALEKEASVPNEVKLIVGQHHEYFDGSGFPNGLRGNAIYDLARIVCIANTFDNLVTEGEGPLAKRQVAALRTLSEKMSAKFEPQKLAKAIKILSMGLPEGT